MTLRKAASDLLTDEDDEIHHNTSRDMNGVSPGEKLKSAAAQPVIIPQSELMEQIQTECEEELQL